MSVPALRVLEPGMGRDWPDIEAALARALQAEPEAWDDRVLHVSDLRHTLDGEGCGRQLWLRLQGAPADEGSLGQALMLDHGTRIHERVSALLDAGLFGSGWRVAEVERDLSAKIRASGLPIDAGRLDVELEHADGRRLILDFKTVRGRAFRYLDEPKPGHVIQIQAYMLVRDVPAGLLIYIDREGQNALRTFRVERHDLAVKRAAKEVRHIADRPAPPPILAPERDRKGKLKLPWQCRLCCYRNVSCRGALG